MAGYGEERQEDEVGDAEGKPQEITEGWEDQEQVVEVRRHPLGEGGVPG
jgi:hypothetical protein